nr:hypothetical protein [Pirellulaceae bacterium]
MAPAVEPLSRVWPAGPRRGMENSKKRSAGPRRATLEKPRRAGTAIVTDPWIIDYETGQPRHPCLEDLRRNTIVAEQLEPVVSISRMDYPVTDVPGPESSLRALEMHLLHHTRHYQVMAASLDSFDQWLGLAEVLGRGGDLSRLITSAVAAGSPLVLNELSFSNQWFPLAGGARVQFVPKGPPNFGRTPPTSETARQIGCDVPAWAKNGWVDFVTVSEFLFERGDLPVGKWKQVITTVPVYGGIEVVWHNKPEGARALSADDYRQQARKLFGAGADGVYIFNMFTSREAA